MRTYCKMLASGLCFAVAALQTVPTLMKDSQTNGFASHESNFAAHEVRLWGVKFVFDFIERHRYITAMSLLLLLCDQYLKPNSL